FLAAVTWAKEQGAKVMTCSVISPAWSDGEGGGTIHARLARLLGDDILLFASAGNTARRNWSGPFHAGTDGWHEWRPGETSNLLTPWGNDLADRVSVELCSQPLTRFEVQLIDKTDGSIAARAETGNAGANCAAARVTPKDSRNFEVRVRQLSGPAGA